MATIGLKVQDSPFSGDLSLADTLAKGIFGDPEAQMKARLLASQVGAHEAYRTKTLADAGLVGVKTKEEQNAEDAILRAGPAVGEAAAAAVPQPVPVEVPRASVPESTRYGPQIVDQTKLNADTARYDALVARERALGPVLVRGTPTQVAEGVGKDYGGAILAGAASNPAIVSGDTLRIAGGLYTGSAPTTSTVWSAGDTSGVDAAAREKIAEEKAGALLPKSVTYRDQPGIQTIGPDGKPVFAGAANTVPTPLKPNTAVVNDVQVETTIDPATGKAVSTPVPGGPSKPQGTQEVDGVPKAVVRDPTTGDIVEMKPIKGAEKAPEPPYPGKTDKAAALNRIAAIQQKVANKQPVSPEEEALYESDYIAAYGPTTTKAVDPATGKPTSTRLFPAVPPNTPSINDLRKYAGLPLAPEPPADVFNPRAPTQEQTQLQQYAPQLINSTARLDKIQPQDVPSVLIQQLTGVNGGDPSFIQQVLASTSFVSPQQREFAQAVAEYNQSLLYMLSGKAITSDEYKRAMRSYIPLPGDDANQLAWKAEQRHTIIASAVRLGFSNDPDMAKKYADNVKRTTGIDLVPLDLTGSLGDVRTPSGSSGGDAPPKSYTDAGGTAAGWAKMTPEKRALFQ